MHIYLQLPTYIRAGTFNATSVSTFPTGSIVDMSFCGAGAPLRLAVGSNGVPHEALVYDLTSGEK